MAGDGSGRFRRRGRCHGLPPPVRESPAILRAAPASARCGGLPARQVVPRQRRPPHGQRRSPSRCHRSGACGQLGSTVRPLTRVSGSPSARTTALVITGPGSALYCQVRLFVPAPWCAATAPWSSWFRRPWVRKRRGAKRGKPSSGHQYLGGVRTIQVLGPPIYNSPYCRVGSIQEPCDFFFRGPLRALCTARR